jgi:small subunit ribosomal protein S16
LKHWKFIARSKSVSRSEINWDLKIENSVTMAVKIRLKRTGRKNAPSYRIIAIDSRKKRDGRALEELGHYNPSVNPPTFAIKKDRLKYWKSVGAQLSEAVEKLIAGKYEYKKYQGSQRKEQEDKSK